jgi:hypothetical protein
MAFAHVLEVGPFVGGGGVEVAEDHLARGLVAGEGFDGGVVVDGDGVADADLAEVLMAAMR